MVSVDVDMIGEASGYQLPVPGFIAPLPARQPDAERGGYTLKLTPQPQVPFAFGLSNRKPLLTRLVS